MHWPYQEQLQLEQQLEVWKTHIRKAYPKASDGATPEPADVKDAASSARV